jgi:ribosomal protein S12 methylthiotransferase accessory factor
MASNRERVQASAGIREKPANPRRTRTPVSGPNRRIVPPAETMARARELFGPLTITRVGVVTGLDCVGIPVAQAYRPNSRSLAVSQGKGLDVEAARVSAVMETIELYHAERITAPLRHASYAELVPQFRLVAPERLPRIDPSRFTPKLNLLWIEGTNLFDESSLWVPYELVHTNYTFPFPPGTGCFVMSSNGLASGNHVLEARLHGLCEVVERDAITLLRHAPETERAARKLELASVSEPSLVDLLERFARAGLVVGVWDATSDIGVPVFHCIVKERDGRGHLQLGPLEGMGCHPRREIALARALTEAAQARVTVIAGARDDFSRSRALRSRDPERAAAAERALGIAGKLPFDRVATHAKDTLEDDLDVLLTGLHQAGLDQAIWVDLTKREFEDQVHVGRIIVPGLETYHQVQGFVPGERLRSRLARGALETPA